MAKVSENDVDSIDMDIVMKGGCNDFDNANPKLPVFPKHLLSGGVSSKIVNYARNCTVWVVE